MTRSAGRRSVMGDELIQQDLEPRTGASLLGLPPGDQGVLSSQFLRKAVDLSIVDAGEFKIPPTSIQPASLDLRLGEVAFRVRSSFLPDTRPVAVKLKEFLVDELDLRRDGAVLETNRPYVVPLLEHLDLPPDVQGRSNPKSSTGRLDVFTRVITDQSFRFDEIKPGYRGKLYLEIVPLSFTVRVKQGLALNQLRLSIGRTRLPDEEIRALHAEQPLLFRGGRPVPASGLAVSDGLFLSLDLRGEEDRRVGYRARDFTPPIEMARVSRYAWGEYWDPVFREEGDRIVLAPEHFYLLLSEEAVRIPPEYAAEMTAYDPTSGELRTHYAGFFDPGFGYDPEDRFLGSRAALEVRAHDVPFAIEHRQRVCRLSFERMIEPPDVLYGDSIGSSYQGQADTLSKHFKQPSGRGLEAPRPPERPPDPMLFDE